MFDSTSQIKEKLLLDSGISVRELDWCVYVFKVHHIICKKTSKFVLGNCCTC